MRRCIVFMCAFLALTACSPRSFIGERAVRTSIISDDYDSTAFHRWLDKAVRESMERHVEMSFDFDAVTVTETFSAPDSTGKQHIISTSTTQMKGTSSSSSGTVSSREESVSDRTDSSSVELAHGELLTEEHEKVNGTIEGFIPWYVYLIALVGAIIIGIGVAMRGKGFKAFRS